mmetsp:Transcript_42563/g.65413  ORF Transcript_42563/g.65413 Transcript_42563/m.65413 type:complete len:236 (-) Transcript_42563:218-925(-)
MSAAAGGAAACGSLAGVADLDLGGAGLVGHDAALGRVQVQRPALDVVEDAPRCPQERLLHILPCLGRHLQVDQPVVLRERLGLLEGDFALLLEVQLISDQHHHRVGVGVIAGVGEPGSEVVEAAPSRDVVHHDRTRRAPVVTSGHGSEALLPSGVPDLQLDHLAGNFAYSRPKLHSNCVWLILLKSVLCELVQQARLAHTHVTDDDVLENVIELAHLALRCNQIIRVEIEPKDAD